MKRPMIKLGMIGSILVLPLPAAAQQRNLLVYGRVLGATPKRAILFIDRASLRQTAPMLREIVSIHYHETAGIGGAMRTDITNLIDCSAKTYKVTHMKAYNDVGAVVLDAAPKDVFTPIKPGSPTESYFAGACDNNWKLGLQEMGGRTIDGILLEGFGRK